MEHIPVDIQDIHRDDRYGCGYDPKICSELLVFQHALPVLEQKEEVHIEVHAEKDHENSDHTVYIGAVIEAHA